MREKKRGNRYNVTIECPHMEVVGLAGALFDLSEELGFLMPGDDGKVRMRELAFPVDAPGHWIAYRYKITSEDAE